MQYIYYFINFFIPDFLSVYKAFSVFGKIILLLDCIYIKFSLYNCSVFDNSQRANNCTNAERHTHNAQRVQRSALFVKVLRNALPLPIVGRFKFFDILQKGYDAITEAVRRIQFIEFVRR